MLYRVPETQAALYNIPIRRIGWGAALPRWMVPLDLPVTHVRLTHTGTSPCTTHKECCSFLKTIQTFYMFEAKLADIPYNFLIGGDGLIYRGRGWYAEPARSAKLERLQHKCLDIAFIGNYENTKPSPELMQVAEDVIAFGLKTEKVSKDYKLIPLGESTPKIPTG